MIEFRNVHKAFDDLQVLLDYRKRLAARPAAKAGRHL